MKIQWLTNQTLIYKNKECRIVLNPQDSPKEDDLSIFTQFESSIQEKGFTIVGPGEYSYRGVTIVVRLFDAEHSTHKNIVSFSTEGMMIVVLNGVSQELSDQEFDFIGNPDILCFDLSSDAKLDTITKIINKIDPRIVIPTAEATSLIHDFMKEYGVKADEEFMSELSVKKSELPFETTEVKLLNSRDN